MGLLLIVCATDDCMAGPQSGADSAGAASPTSGDVQKPVATGNFLSSIKQAFHQDFDREVVRGHFDLGAPPDAHRYYCLIDPKTGKSEPNGVGGQPFVRPDKMTGIKSGAVAFYSCANAEEQGILVTTGYVLAAGVAARIVPPAAPQTAATAEHETTVTASQSAIMAIFGRFIAGQNAHDRAAVSDVLLDSKDFLWAQYGGNSIWGHKEAVEEFQNDWKGSWKLDPQQKQLRISNVASGTAILITPLLVTQGEVGAAPNTVPVRWGGMFVKTAAGWRIATIFITPYPGFRPDD